MIESTAVCFSKNRKVIGVAKIAKPKPAIPCKKQAKERSKTKSKVLIVLANVRIIHSVNLSLPLSINYYFGLIYGSFLV